MTGIFMALSLNFFNPVLVCVLVGNEKSSSDVTTVWILSLSIEESVVNFGVIVVDGIIKGKNNHHWHFGVVKSTRNLRSTGRTEAIWKPAHISVALICSIRVVPRAAQV